MEHVHGIGEQPDLLKVVHGVRGRWKAKHALRGATLTVGARFVVYALTSWAIHAAASSATAIVAGRVASIASLVVLAFVFIVRPLLPKVRDEQVALYLEEHEPSLEGAMVTAVEVDAARRAGTAP